MGREMVGRREEYMVGGDSNLGFSLRFYIDGIQSEDLQRQNTPLGPEDFVEVLVAGCSVSLIFQLLPSNNLALTFYYEEQLEFVLQCILVKSLYVSVLEKREYLNTTHKELLGVEGGVFSMSKLFEILRTQTGLQT